MSTTVEKREGGANPCASKPCPQCAGEVSYPSTAKQWTKVGSVIRLSAEVLTLQAPGVSKLIVAACDGECGYAELGIEPLPQLPSDFVNAPIDPGGPA